MKTGFLLIVWIGLLFPSTPEAHAIPNDWTIDELLEEKMQEMMKMREMKKMQDMMKMQGMMGMLQQNSFGSNEIVASLTVCIFS